MTLSYMFYLSYLCSLSLSPFGQVGWVVCHHAVKSVAKLLVQLFKLFMIINHPDDCAVASCFHMTKQSL